MSMRIERVAAPRNITADRDAYKKQWWEENKQRVNRQRRQQYRRGKQHREENPDPIPFLMKGKRVDFFTVPRLARILGRSVSSIRGLIRRGSIPKARYRKPGESTPLYTQAEVDLLKSLMVRYGRENKWPTQRECPQLYNELEARWADINNESAEHGEKT